MADRKDFYFDQQVTQAELDSGFAGLELADRDLVSDLLGKGFKVTAAEPATVLQSATPALTVRVNAFLGYDQLGQRVSNVRSAYQGGSNIGASPQLALNMAVDENGASTAVATPGNEKILSIFVEFQRHQQDLRTDGNGAPVYFDQQESIKFNVVQSAEAAVGAAVAPPLRNDQLLLADVTIIQGQTEILNANIDQTRREDFVLELPHGGSHTENGDDPIPNATTGEGGLMSAADKTKLDSITWTGAGVGALFNTQAGLYEPSTVSAPAGLTLDVTARFVGKAAGGAANKEGIVTQSGGADGILQILNEDYDDFLDSQGNKVYGKLVVDDETTPTTWTLHFFSHDETAGEQAFDMTPYAGAVVRLRAVETFRLHNLPTFKKYGVGAFKDQGAGEIPDATTTLKGKVLLAADGESAAGKAVQANDSRLGGGVQVRKNAGSFSTARTKINMIEGSGIGITVTDDSGDGEVEITIAAGASSYRMRSSGQALNTNGNLAHSPNDSGAYTPRLALHMGTISGVTLIGFAVSTSIEACWASAGATDTINGSNFVHNGSADIWNINQFDSGSVTAARSSGSGTYNGTMFVVGDG